MIRYNNTRIFLEKESFLKRDEYATNVYVLDARLPSVLDTKFNVVIILFTSFDYLSSPASIRKQTFDEVSQRWQNWRLKCLLSIANYE